MRMIIRGKLSVLNKLLIFILPLGFVWGGWALWGRNSTGPVEKKPNNHAAEADLFSGTKVLQIRIDISPTGMTALRNAGWGNGVERPSVKAILREGGVSYTNVAAHLKGAAGSFRSIDDNPGFTLNFDKFAPGQHFHGLTKLSLNNSVQDPSFLTEKICRELFETAGLPVARAAYARVVLNGRDLGLRVLTEGFNKQLLKRYFKNTKGNLYDGGFVQDITAPLAVNSGDNPKDDSGLRALASAAREPDPIRRMARLEQVLDMDRFLSFIALEVMLCHWDGYAMNHNNWRLFHDLGSNKMYFFPHGMDQMFGVQRSSPECPIVPSMRGLVARAVVGTATGRQQYLEHMAQLYTNVFNVNRILRRIDELEAVIRPVIAASDPAAARDQDQEVKWLKERIVQRDESLRRQLAAVAARVKPDANGMIRLSGWKPKIQSGVPVLREMEQPETGTVYSISVPTGNAVGSWRTKVLLEPGYYRFEGKIRTRDVQPGSGDSRAGAGLRISGGAMVKEVTGSNDWHNYSYAFEATDEESEVEFICELRAARGEAWFASASLQVVRQR